MTKEKFKTAGKTLNQQGWKNTSSYFLRANYEIGINGTLIATLFFIDDDYANVVPDKSLFYLLLNEKEYSSENLDELLIKVNEYQNGVEV